MAALFMLSIPLSHLTHSEERDPSTREPNINQLIEENKEVIDALVLYSKEIRQAILEASLFPNFLNQIRDIQKISSQDFQKIIENFSRNTQIELYDLAKYPGLMQNMSDKGKTYEDKIQILIKNYPKEVRTFALKYAKPDYQNTLANINEIQEKTTTRFNKLIQTTSPETQKAFQSLIENPEVLQVLLDYQDLIILIGDLYRKNPTEIQNRARKRRDQLEKDDKNDLENWIQELEANPEYVDYINSTSREYEEIAEMDLEETPPLFTSSGQIYVYPYYFWYGRPYWFKQATWYPQPLWYHRGFYRGPNGVLWVYRTPSFYYTNWFFRYPRNLYRYPFLSNGYINHYQINVNINTGLNDSVRDWINQNSPYFPKDFLNKDFNRPERIRDFGKFEEDFARFNQNHPNNPLNRKDFLKNNLDRYPHLNQSKIRPTNLQRPNPRTRPAIRQPRPGNYLNRRRANDFHLRQWNRFGQGSFRRPAMRPGRRR